MDPFEKKLIRLPWRRPSQDLRDRIFGDSSNSEPRPTKRMWKIDLKWAAALILGAGLFGYMTGRVQVVETLPSDHPPPLSNVTIVIDSEPAFNLFDMTPRANSILPEDYVVSSNAAGGADI